jgi:hypothetical protein
MTTFSKRATQHEKRGRYKDIKSNYTLLNPTKRSVTTRTRSKFWVPTDLGNYEEYWRFEFIPCWDKSGVPLYLHVINSLSTAGQTYSHKLYTLKIFVMMTSNHPVVQN